MPKFCAKFFRTRIEPPPLFPDVLDKNVSRWPRRYHEAKLQTLQETWLSVLSTIGARVSGSFQGCTESNCQARRVHPTISLVPRPNCPGISFEKHYDSEPVSIPSGSVGIEPQVQTGRMRRGDASDDRDVRYRYRVQLLSSHDDARVDNRQVSDTVPPHKAPFPQTPAKKSNHD